VHFDETRRYTDYKKRFIESWWHSSTHLHFNVMSIKVDTTRVNHDAIGRRNVLSSKEHVVKIYGHRGASAFEPENTLLAFRRAIEIGVEGLELDVQCTSDRVPVVLHDRDLARTTNGSGQIDSISFAQLRQFDAGRGEVVPTLEEVLTLVEDTVHLDIEIKQIGIESEVLTVLGGHPDVKWTVSSFDWTSLERFRTLSPSADIWLLGVVASDALFSTARRLKASGVALYAPSFTTQTAPRFREAGLTVTIWTVNDIDEAKRVRELGANALCTDDPRLMIEGLSEIA